VEAHRQVWLWSSFWGRGFPADAIPQCNASWSSYLTESPRGQCSWLPRSSSCLEWFCLPWGSVTQGNTQHFRWLQSRNKTFTSLITHFNRTSQKHVQVIFQPPTKNKTKSLFLGPRRYFSIVTLFSWHLSIFSPYLNYSNKNQYKSIKITKKKNGYVLWTFHENNVTTAVFLIYFLFG